MKKILIDDTFTTDVEVFLASKKNIKMDSLRIAIMQPYFLPFIGYFQLVNAVDKFVIYDDVQFIRGWINRNYILLNGERHLINLLLTGASLNKTINNIELQPNQRKLIKTIEYVYKKAPMFDEVFPVFLNIMEYEEKNLGKFLGNSITQICKYLQVNTEFFFSSDINKNSTLKGQNKILHICKLLETSSYVNTIAGETLYNKDDFEKQNIELKFLKSKTQGYPQFKNEFVPNLSILDVMMFNSIEEIRQMLDNYELA